MDDEGSTALMLAAADGNLSEMRRLISLGAEVDARNDWKASALIWACAAGESATAFELIDAGADVDRDGADAVYIAARLGHEGLAWALVDKGLAAKPEEVSQSLVSIAPFLGTRFARYCVRRGACLGAADPEGSTVMMQAALQGNRRLVKWLLRNGAAVDQKDSNGSTALTYAMEGFQRSAIILDLLRAGASPKTKSRFAGDTVLHYAVGAEDFDLARKVLLLGADPDAKDDSGKTAFERYHRDVPRIEAEIEKLRDFAMTLRSTAPRDEAHEQSTAPLLTRKFKKETLRAVLAELYKGQNLEYSVDPQVPEMRLTFEFQGLTFSQARRAFMRAVRKRLPAFHAGTDTEVWVFKLRELPPVDVREID